MRYITFFLIVCLFTSKVFAFEAAPLLTDGNFIIFGRVKGGLDKLNARFDDRTVGLKEL